MQLIGEKIFLVFISLAIVNIFLIPISWLIISYTIPKKLLERYFKAPHFGPGELVLMAKFPGSLLRGSIFNASCIIPSKGQRRQMTDVPDHAPKWFVIGAHVYFYGVLVIFFGGWMLLFLILMVISHFTG